MKDEALQFANELDELQRAEYPNHYEAADEIRRLHSVNAELLEALQMLLANPNSGLWANAARSAIAKAQKKGQP